MIERKDLSEDQEKALQHMIKFVSSRDRQMLLAGYAGTGKSTLLRLFLGYMSEHKSGTEIVCTAPTNEAVIVIAKITGEDYSKTIFSLLGFSISEKAVQRAGLDYWDKLEIEEHDSFERFLEKYKP
jgi:energy-coupling factor transporter ATP-binding protein EcfA2